ncbi:hypothetical protein JAAARDRAFT_611606 [Jaapia argillacea MUCL 33604]|uniref:Uncharacterized protein n=1 Tax=Jaapia argillacea MUCL 33604 TaxID=933084 RepID=A0A067PHP5_9AGAM|nr:hypothetical protein JAAARDRAFT_611606 [Jaapia argillacea MUCL 33604]
MVRERGRKVAMVGMVPAIVPRFRPATGVTGRKSRHQDRVASVFVRGARNVPSERRIYSLPNRSISIEGSSESDGWSDSNSSEVDGEAVPHMKYYNDNHEMDLDSDVDVASTIAHPGSPLQDFEDTEFTTPLNFESEELPSRCSHPLLDPLFISYTILVGFLILFSPTSLSTPTSFTPLLNKFLPVEPPRRVEYYSECALRHVFVFLAFTFAIAQVFGAEGGVGLVVSVMAPAVLWVWWGVWDEGSPFQGGGDYRGDEAEGDREMIWRVLTRSSQNYHGDLVVSDRMRSVGTKSTYKVGGERGRREYIFAK